MSPPPPVSCGKPSLKARLEAYYELVAPETLQKDWRKRFDAIWDKFGGTIEGERQLQAKLAKKYGSFVEFQIAGPKESPKTVITRKTRPESWYILKNIERMGNVDILSDSFDPVAALARPGYLQAQFPFVEQAPKFDRVDQCRCLLPKDDPEYQPRQATTTKATTSRPATTKAPSCFASIADQFETGPLQYLKSLLTQRRPRVRVLTRYNSGIRGTLTGQLVAFDKHWNLILRDVDESYTQIARRNDQSMIQHEIFRRRQGRQKRHMAQLMVRGDTIVLVYRVADEQSVVPTPPVPVVSEYCRKPPISRVGTPGAPPPR